MNINIININMILFATNLDQKKSIPMQALWTKATTLAPTAKLSKIEPKEVGGKKNMFNRQ